MLGGGGSSDGPTGVMITADLTPAEAAELDPPPSLVISTEGRKSRIEHWNGSRWRLVHAPFGSNDALVGFSATAWNDAWAVGSYGLGGNNIAKYSHALAAS